MARTWKDAKRYSPRPRFIVRSEDQSLDGEQPRSQKPSKKRFHGCDRQRGRRRIDQ